MINARAHEEKIIRTLQKHIPMLPQDIGLGIGDDTAFINKDKLKKNKILTTTDTLAEEIHFTWSFSSPAEVAIKLFEMNASDILSKGGMPLFALLNLSLTKKTAQNQKAITEFAKSLGKRMKEKKVYLIGGDVTSASSCVFTMTLLGECDNFIPRKNNNIQKGDLLILLGNTGGSKYALDKLYSSEKINKTIKNFYTSPSARWEAPQILKSLMAKASIDTSDSLYESFEILTRENNISLKVNLDKINIPDFLKTENQQEQYSYLLSSGEDFAVLAVTPKKSINAASNSQIQVIGEVTEKGKEDISFYVNNMPVKISETGLKLFSHF